MNKHEQHEHVKTTYPNKTQAIGQIKSLRSEHSGKDGTERLQAYYSREDKDWHIGKCKKKDYWAMTKQY